jgi:hypothetical protein
MLSTLVGFTLTSTAASATRPGHGHYPPPPPSVVIHHGVVKKGATVRAIGRKYKARERVIIIVRFKPKGSNSYRIIRTTSVRADRNGRFFYSVRAIRAGTMVITAVGRFSRQSASAFVLVIDKRKWGRGRGWAMEPVAFTSGSGAVAAAPKSEAPAGDVAGLAIAGLAMMTIAGGALVTQRTVRRRRKADVAA